MPKQTRNLALLCAVVLLAGCTAPLPPSSEGGTSPAVSQSSASSTPASDSAPPQPLLEDDSTYTIYLDSNTILEFDSKGNLLSSGNRTPSSTPLLSDGAVDDSLLMDIEDVLTGKPAYKKHTLVEATSEPDEYGNVQIKRTTALYDLSGQLLVDYGDYDYGFALGDLLIRKDHRGMWVSVDDVPADYFSQLWNPATDQVVQPNVNELQPLDEAKTQLLATDVFGGVLGIVDSKGQTLLDMDETVTYYNPVSWNGMFIVRDQHPQNWEATSTSWLLTKELTPVVSYELLSGGVTPEGTPYLEYRDEQGGRGLLDGELKPLFTSPGPDSMINMFDGELVLCSSPLQPDDGNHSRQQQLLRLDGTPVGKAYEQIETMEESLWDLTQKPQQFVGQQGELVELFDRQGQVLASRTIPELQSLQVMNDRLLRYALPVSEYSYQWGLLDKSLQTVMEADKYTNLYSPGGRDAAALVCGRYDVNGNVDRVDVFDTELRPITTALTQLGTVGKDRFAAVRGFQAGVMDLQGNWIGSVSIFQHTGDETLSEEDYF